MKETITELLAEKKFPELRRTLNEMYPADLAILLDDFPIEEMILLFRLLSKDNAAEVFAEMEPDKQEALVTAFSDNELKAVINELFVDDAADLVDEMPTNVVKRILKQASPDMRKSINELLKYPDDSAGSIMTTEFVALLGDMTVEEAFDRIRKTGVDKETIYTCYVTDRDKHLCGVVTVRELLLAAPESRIRDIMTEHVVAVRTLEDKESVAEKISRYNFLALPVVDNEDRLVGIVTFDDAIDVMEDEATEDIEKMAAITPTDKPYLKTGVWETFGKRIPWLLLLMVSATFTSGIINTFESALSHMVVLTAFIPMLMDTGGNAGGQSSVTIIRALSLGDVEFRDIFRVIWKEIRVAVLCGVVLSGVNFGKILLFGESGGSVAVAAVVSITLLITVIFAKMVGCILPLLAKKVGFDPAVMASPFITTVVDAISLLVYFNVAEAFLHL